MKNNFRKEIESIQNEISYDPDSSPYSWKHFSDFYIIKHWRDVKNFDFNNLQEIKNKGIIRLISRTASNNSKFGDFELAGDTDFNFKEDTSVEKTSKYEKFKKLLEQENIDSKEFGKLELCKRNHHTLVNFSLMPRTGGMNSFKGTFKGENENFCFDRFDSFVYNLNNFYCKSDPLIISRPNGKYLEKFLSAFENIYDYCRVFYFIDDRDFVDRIIKEGQQPISNGEDVIRYMNLAIDYWNIKEKYFLEHLD